MEPVESSDGALYPIRTVADLTGVNAITLRAWERRYGLFQPVRKASGHRLYTQADIDLITRVVGLLDRGIRIGQVKSQLEAGGASTREASLNETWKRYLDRMVAAVIRFDEAELEAVYEEALSLHAVGAVTEKLMTPLLRELGRRWEDGEASVAEEHFFAFYLRNKIGARFHHRARPATGPKLLLACLPGERHETGLLLFALAASEAGYRTIMLGADMPLEDLPSAVRRTGCRAIILSASMPPAPEVLEESLSRLAEASEAPVFVGGQASVSAHDELRRAKVVALGTDVATGLARLRQAVPVG